MTTWQVLVGLLFLCVLLSPVNGARTRSGVRNRNRNGLTRDEWLQRQLMVQGPHVCASEKLTDSTRRFIFPWTQGHLCGVPTEIRFECCEGFAIANHEPGCSFVKPLVNLVESVRGNGASGFAHGITESGLHRSLANDGPYTLFAPVNHAFLNASEELIAMLNKKTSMQGSAPSLLMYHLVPNRVHVKDLVDGMLLPTFYYQQPLRVHRFPSGLITINCVPLVAGDLEATNGVMHKVETILKPPTQNSITDQIVREPALSRLATLIVQAKMSDFLRDKSPLTFFAPTDQAFALLAPEDLNALANDTQVMKTLLEHHVVTKVWCSTIMDKSKMTALDGQELLISCNSTHKFVDEAVILQSDAMAANGFINVIDQVLLPQKVKSLKTVIEDLGLITFLSFLQMSALENALTNTPKFTIFAPTEEAFDGLSNETYQELVNNRVAVQDLFMGHLVPGEFTTSHLLDEQPLGTLKPGRRLKIRIHRDRITVDGILLKDRDHECRNGVIHIVEKIIFVPEMTITQFLQSESTLSGFSGALNLTSPSMLDLLDSGRGLFTVFAPDNYGMSLLPPGHLERMILDPIILNTVLKDHVVDEIVTMSSLLPNGMYSYQTLGHRLLHLRVDDDGSVSAGMAIITRSDIRCSNGVVHIINRLIQLQ